MKDVTVVTGPLRSGTSCVTGLLEQCGFDLGTNIRVLRKQTEYNPRGHFELNLLHTINARLMVETDCPGRDMFHPPDAASLATLAANRDRYFELFLEKFDGNLCKDTMFCLTLPHWERHWPELKRSVFCLRHPLAVARSIHQRYGFSEEEGLELWKTYTERFVSAEKQSRTTIFDFDAFTRSPGIRFRRLLDELQFHCEEKRLRKIVADFFDKDFVHHQLEEREVNALPSSIKQLYEELCREARQPEQSGGSR